MSDTATLTVLGVGASVLVVVLVRSLVKALLRRRAMREPFPEEWRELLQRALPLYSRMPAELRLQLEPLTRGFMRDVRFVGCDGLEVTDEMRLIIAFQASLLIVGNDVDSYRGLMNVLLYPDAFVSIGEEVDEGGVVTPFEDPASGESFETSRILLSWRDIAEPPDDEIFNVVLHEFAHYLDNLVDAGTHDTLKAELDAHREAIEAGRETLIHPDAADDPAEFFAYATEAFFEAPHELKRLHPTLYEGLKTGYGLDPAGW